MWLHGQKIDLPIVEFREQVPLVEDRVDAFLCDDPLLAHLFHSKFFNTSFVLNSPNSSEASLADDIMREKVIL